MTATNDPADVIEQAVRVLAAKEDETGCNLSWEESAHALHAAGLLADPAGRDERRNEAYRAQLARADRAEAEVAGLRATIAKVRSIHERREQDDSDIADEWCVEEDADWPCATIRALDGAGEQ